MFTYINDHVNDTRMREIVHPVIWEIYQLHDDPQPPTYGRAADLFARGGLDALAHATTLQEWLIRIIMDFNIGDAEMEVLWWEIYTNFLYPHEEVSERYELGFNMADDRADIQDVIDGIIAAAGSKTPVSYTTAKRLAKASEFSLDNWLTSLTDTETSENEPRRIWGYLLNTWGYAAAPQDLA